MSPVIGRKTVLVTGIVLGLAVLAGVAAVYSGAYNVAADAPHTRPVLALLETARQRSIATRAGRLQVPADLNDPARIRQGAGNYDAMCSGCHLAPGAEETELSRGLYPTPPNLARESVGAAEAFWAIKHGIKASGMPAWGKSMDDEYIWNMAAFLQELPKLDKAGYDALVASSSGHSHGGGETAGHSHPAAGDNHHEADEAGPHEAGDAQAKALADPRAAAIKPEAKPSTPTDQDHDHHTGHEHQH